LNGLIYSIALAVLLLIAPLSEALTEESRNSKLADKLSGGYREAQALFEPLINDLNGSISKIAINPTSKKFVKLGFSVKNAKRRTDLEAEMLILVNKERQKARLKPLKPDPEMAEVALKHSSDMFARGYFSHISPEGATPFDRMKKANVIFFTAGENLALAQSLSLAHTGLMNSPGHRANILHKSFGRLGIGILDGGVYGIMVTQNFRN
jgi:uncharacterized protein YkwD